MAAPRRLVIAFVLEIQQQPLEKKVEVAKGGTYVPVAAAGGSVTAGYSTSVRGNPIDIVVP